MKEEILELFQFVQLSDFVFFYFLGLLAHYIGAGKEKREKIYIIL